MSGKVLGPEFFRRDSHQVARELLGRHLCQPGPDGSVRRFPVTELEVYDGFEDRASHASKGRTARNAVMFGPGGFWYVYLCYGMHWMLNITTREEGYPAALLVRGAGGWGGPGKLTKALGLNKLTNELSATPDSGLWFEDAAAVVEEDQVERLPRVGVDYAGPEWSAKPWRLRWKTHFSREPNP